MVLNFAEAANKVVGPSDATKYGISAKAAMQYLRTRKTTDGAVLYTTANDVYLNEVATDQTKFDTFVKDERRIETCFEGMRFYDIRRWSTGLTDINKAVHKAEPTKNADGTFSYDLSKEAESRAFKSAYLPIPYVEILRMSKLEPKRRLGRLEIILKKTDRYEKNIDCSNAGCSHGLMLQ